jgi:putative ABC transport system permease protein
VSSRTVTFGESARLALDVIRAHKLRSGLLVLGVAIGVMVLMGMVSILTGLSRKIEKDIRATDQTVVTLSKFDFLTEGDPDNPRILARPDITPDDARALDERCPSVDVAEFYVDANRPQILYRGKERTRPIFVNGGGARILHVYSIPTAVGRYFTDGEILSSAHVAYLGAGPADDLFPSEDPLGKRIRIGDEHFTVVGVAAERKSLFGGMADNFAFVPWTTFRKTLAGEREPYYAYLTAAPGRSVDDVVQEARVVMRQRHHLRPGDPDDFALISNDRIEEFVKRITGPIGVVLLVLSSIGLTVGGIGVMNIMLVSVTERTHEIGLRKAVGARRGTILAQFLVEAAVLTGVGGIVGVAAGFTLAALVSRFAHLPALVNPASAAGGVVFSVLLGIFFGLYPASRAARLDPIEALRHE